MSADSSKSWVAIGRRHEQDVSLTDAYTEVFESLAWAQGKCPMPIADTIIFGRLSTTYYAYDWPQQRVMTMPSISTPAQALKQFMSMDEGNSISGVFLTEVKDSNGYLIAVEYLTIHALSTFFQSGDSKKIGVLQRFVYPRPFRHVDEVAQEVLVSYHASGGNYGGAAVTVERRLGSHPLDGAMEHPTVRGNLFHPVPTCGKVVARSLPFSAAECRYGLQAETITDQDYVFVCKEASHFIVAALQSFRRLVYDETIASNSGRNSPDRSSRPPVRPVSRMVAQFRQSFHDSQIYFLGLISLRHPADKYHVDVRYDFIKIPTEGVKYVTSPPSQGELTITPLTQLQSVLHATTIAAKRSAGGDGASPQSAAGAPAAEVEEQDMDDDDDPNGFNPHRRPANPELFACPNCDQVYHRDTFVRMEYREIVAHYLSECRVAHQQTVHKLQTGRKDGGDALHMYKTPGRPSSASAGGPASGKKPTRPQTARTRPPTASGAEAASPHADEAAPTALVVTAAKGTSVVPAVLAKLNIPVAELVHKPVRLLRSVPLCAACATSFGATIVPTAAGTGCGGGHYSDMFVAGAASGQDAETADAKQASPHRSVSPHDKYVESTKQRLASAPPSCLRSEVIDQMVVTPLQEHHRWLRQGERIRYQAKIHDSERVIAEHQSAKVAELASAEEQQLSAMLESFGIRDVISVPAVASVSECCSLSATTSPMQQSLSPPPPLGSTSSRRVRGKHAVSKNTEVEVLGTGPDVPLQTLLQNDLFYKLQAAIDNSDPRDGVSMAHDSTALPPIPRPSMVVLAEDIDSAAVQHLKKTGNAVRQGRKAAWRILEKNSTTFCDMTEEERLIVVNMVGGDPSNVLLIEDEGGLDGFS